MSDLHAIVPTAFLGSHSNSTSSSKFHQPRAVPFATDADTLPHPHEYSPTSSINGMPPAPLAEDNAPIAVAGNGGGSMNGNSSFDLSDEQAEQLLRELDLLGAQLQIMDHETRMLGTKSGGNNQDNSHQQEGNGGAGGYSFGGGNGGGLHTQLPQLSHAGGISGNGAATPYRMQLTEQPTVDEDNAEESEDIALNPSDLTDADTDEASGRSRSAGRSPRKQRKMFVPRKPTTAEALGAVDVSALPVHPSDLEPLELAAEPKNSLLPKNWVNSFSRLLNRRNSTASNQPFSDGLGSSMNAVSSLERSRTVGARPRPHSMMSFGAGARRHKSIFATISEQQPIQVDLEALATSSVSPTTKNNNGTADAKPTKARRARPYSMGFFARAATTDSLMTAANMADSKAAGHDTEANSLLKQLDALNQELTVNPKSVRLQNDSVQAGTAALLSLARRRSPSATRGNESSNGNADAGQAHAIFGRMIEEEEEEVQGVTLNAGGAVSHARRLSASVFTFA